jgi:hypothetical protein
MTSTNTRNTELRKLTLLLYYPAVLGAGLLCVVTRWAEIGSTREILCHVENYIAVWLICFFSVSYLVTDATPEEKYNWWAFTCDIVEIAAMFLGFYFLGFISTKRPLDIKTVYYILASLPFIQALWILAVGRYKQMLIGLSMFATIFLLGAARWSTHSFVNFIAVAILFGLLAYSHQRRFPG